MTVLEFILPALVVILLSLPLIKKYLQEKVRKKR